MSDWRDVDSKALWAKLLMAVDDDPVGYQHVTEQLGDLSERGMLNSGPAKREALAAAARLGLRWDSDHDRFRRPWPHRHRLLVVGAVVLCSVALTIVLVGVWGDAGGTVAAVAFGLAGLVVSLWDRFS